MSKGYVTENLHRSSSSFPLFQILSQSKPSFQHHQVSQWLSIISYNIPFLQLGHVVLGLIWNYLSALFFASLCPATKSMLLSRVCFHVHPNMECIEIHPLIIRVDANIYIRGGNGSGWRWQNNKKTLYTVLSQRVCDRFSVVSFVQIQMEKRNFPMSFNRIFIELLVWWCCKNE